MQLVYEAASAIDVFLREEGFEYCVTGVLALRHWGRQRLTDSIDILIWAGFGQEDRVTDDLLRCQWSPRVPRPHDFARSTRALPLLAPNGTPISISYGALPFEQTILDRAVPATVAPHCTIRLAAAEDLILLNLFAFRQDEVDDAQSIVYRQRGRIQWPYLEFWLPQIAELKDDQRIYQVFEQLRRPAPNHI